MLDRATLAEQIRQHVDGVLALEDLAAWAEEAFRDDELESEYADQIAEILSLIRDSMDPHRFRWEEPDFEEILDDLELT